MKKILINCDIGERGIANSIDDKIFQFIDIANIACGGHTGDKDSCQYYADLCQKYNLISCLHLSYPDKLGFGRRTFHIIWQNLELSLNQQKILLPQCQYLKFHGQLYNDSQVDNCLAKNLAKWIEFNSIKFVITSPSGQLAKILANKVEILPEFFVERRYIYRHNQLYLMPRTNPLAVIENIDLVIEQLNFFLANHQVKALNQQNLWRDYSLIATTISLHSDNPNSLEIAFKIRQIIDVLC